MLAAGCATTLGLRITSAADNPGDVAVPIQIGAEYEVIGELYVHEVATDLNNRTLAFMVLVPLRLSGPEILSRRVVNPGSRVRIVAMRDRRWPKFFFPDQYVVEVDSIPTTGDVPVVLGLSRGNEGNAGSLNPSIYRQLR
jgi:hypothetical protein